jgi:hypothetical protein
MKLAHLLPSLKSDIAKICQHWGFNIATANTAQLFQLLHNVSTQRAYNDTHPYFQAGNKRVLDYDGRDYCWYYGKREDRITDDHVVTLLKKIQKELS